MSQTVLNCSGFPQGKTTVLHPSPVLGAAVLAGYVTQWTAFDISNVKASLLTHLMYAFIGINEDASLNIQQNSYDHFNHLQSLKSQNGNIKILLSIGGATGSWAFSYLKSNSSKQTFAQNCLKILKQYKFSGIDLDWEYPSADQKRDYSDLLMILRQTLGNSYLVTSAVPAGVQNLAGFDAAIMNKYLDYAFIMTYDFAGSWNSVTGHNAPLFGTGPYNVKGAIDAWKIKGLSTSKTVVGLAFYGLQFALNGNLGSQASTVGASASFVQTLTWDQIKSKTFKREWDSVAQTSYGVNGKQWFSFDDVESLQKKVNFACNVSKGVMIWELGQNIDQSLLSAINKQMKSVCGLITSSTTNNNNNSSKTTLGTTTDFTEDDNINASNSCTNNLSTLCSLFSQNGALAFVKYPKDCNKYVDCRVHVLKSCPSGLIWNPEAVTCDWPHAFSCKPC